MKSSSSKALLYIFILLGTLAQAQTPLSHHYRQWVFGYDYFPDLRWGQNVLDFNDGTVTIAHYDKGVDYEVGGSGSLLCDAEGQLALITNGCHVSDADFNIIAQGDTLNGYDWAYQNYCELGFPLPSIQSTMLYPRANGAVLIHKDIANDNGAISYRIRVKGITESGGHYRVTSDRTIIDSVLMFGKLKTTYHANGEDIWVIATPHNSNEFISYLVREDTIIRSVPQVLGPVLEPFTYGRIRQVTFSSHNDMMAFNSIEGLLVYDYDDSTGLISNYRCYKYPTLVSDSINRIARGVCFSPSDEFVYVNNGERIFQIKVDSDPDKPEFHDYDFQRIAGSNGTPIGIGNMLVGPDCKIYVSCATTTFYMHVIHRPDRQGAAAELQKHIPVPMRIYHNFPFIPNLASSCDSSIEWDIHTSVLEPLGSEADKQPLILYPNPAITQSTLVMAPESEGTVQVRDLYGRLFCKRWKYKGDRELTMDVSDWDKGSYIITFGSRDGEYVGKLVKL